MNTNKTIFASICVITCGIIYTSHLYFQHKLNLRTQTETRDRFVVCIDTAMSKSIEANKPIDIDKAKEICENLQK